MRVPVVTADSFGYVYHRPSIHNIPHRIAKSCFETCCKVHSFAQGAAILHPNCSTHVQQPKAKHCVEIVDWRAVKSEDGFSFSRGRARRASSSFKLLSRFRLVFNTYTFFFWIFWGTEGRRRQNYDYHHYCYYFGGDGVRRGAEICIIYSTRHARKRRRKTRHFNLGWIDAV